MDLIVDTYEIRILHTGGNPPDIFSSSHVSDHAAVRRAHALAKEASAIEVWRGLSCIYSGAPDAHLPQ
jgi:hypothetical protein